MSAKNPGQVFNWKYAPSIDLDSVVPNIDDVENDGLYCKISLFSLNIKFMV